MKKRQRVWGMTAAEWHRHGGSLYGASESDEQAEMLAALEAEGIPVGDGHLDRAPRQLSADEACEGDDW